MTGDTRPSACDQNANYPIALHTQIIQLMAKMNPQFVLDLGDHMYVCSQSLANAQLQMGYYVQGLQGFPTYFAMTMGNHECEGGKDCSSNPNATPIWVSPSGLCQNNLEDGDVIEGLPNATFPMTMNGFTYHPQNEALLQWFAGQTPSSAYRGAYSYPDMSVLTSAAVSTQPDCATPFTAKTK